MGLGAQRKRILGAMEAVRVVFTRLMKPQEVAFILNISERHLRRLVEEGKIPYVEIDGAPRFLPEDIREWIKKRRRE